MRRLMVYKIRMETGKMKKIVCAGLGLLLCAGLLAGCGKEQEADSSVVSVDKKGTVTFLDVQELNPDEYDAEELESYVNDTVDAYTEEHGKGTVTLEGLTEEDGKAKLKLKFKTADDFTAFHGIELYQGKVVSSLAAGYVYDGDFVRVEDGKVVGAATKQEIYNEDNLKVVILKANLDVRVDGEICYVSSQNVKLTGKDSVSIREGYYLMGGSSDGAVEIQGEVITGTENNSNTENGGNTAESGGEDAGGSTGSGLSADSGYFNSDVYTFIVYK